MENNDWDEIKKYSEKYEKENIDKYGINLSNQLDKRIQKKDKNKYKRKTIKISLKTALIIIFTIILLPLLYQVFVVIMDSALGFSSFHGIDVEKEMQSYCEGKLELISKNVDDKGNGTYIFQSQKIPEIEVHAIRHTRNAWNNDLTPSVIKYFFEKWENPDKNLFKVEEEYNKDGILYYDLYIDVETYEDFEYALDLIIDFLEFKDGFNHTVDSNIHIRKNDVLITPTRYPQTVDELRIELEEQYKTYFN